MAAHLARASAFLRPDGLAAGVVVRGSLAWERCRIPRGSASILSAWIVPVALLLLARYDSLVPHSVVAMCSSIYQVSPLTNGLQFVYHFGGLFVGAAQRLSARELVIPPDVRLAVLYGLLADRREPRSPGWQPVVSGHCLPCSLCGVYTALGLRGSVMAEWYVVPFLHMWIIFFLDGPREALAGFRANLRRLASLVLGAPMLACMVGGLNLGCDASRPFLAPFMAWDERQRLYAQAPSFLSPLLGDRDIVATSEIGAVGYACDCRILDTVGLASPGSLRYYPISGDLPALNAVPTALLRDLVPDYLVSLEVFMRPTLLQDGWFRGNYRQILRLGTCAFGSDGLLVYQRLL